MGSYSQSDIFLDDLKNLRPGGIVRLDPSQRMAMQQMAFAEANLRQQLYLQQARLTSELAVTQAAAMQNAYAPPPLPPYRDSQKCREGAELGGRMADRIAFWQGFLGHLAGPFVSRIAEALESLCEHMEARLALYPAQSDRLAEKPSTVARAEQE